MLPCFDLHNHTVASGHAYSTIEEIAASAKSRGLALVGIADHGPAMPGGPHLYYFGNHRQVPRQMAGIEIRFGVEANIISTDGKLDLPEWLLKELDFVAAGLHTDTGYEGRSKAEHTKALLSALENPYVDFIVHPGNPRFPIDEAAVARKAAETGVALEVNNSSLTVTRLGSEEICLRIITKLKEFDGVVILGSDSHISSNVGNLDAALALVRRAGLGDEQILNASCGRLEKYLASRRRHKK